MAEVVNLQLDRGFRLEFTLGNMGRIRGVGFKPKARFYWGFLKGRARLMPYCLVSLRGVAPRHTDIFFGCLQFATSDQCWKIPTAAKD